MLKIIGKVCFLIMLFSIQVHVCMGKQLQQLQRTVEKLHNTILSISTENTKYKMLVEDLAEKMIIQERRIGELERKCKISNDGLSEEYTNKSTDSENLENYHDVKRVDSKKSTLPGQVLKLAQSRRAIHSGRNLNVAFFAYMNRDQKTPSSRHTLIFDIVRTNLGNHYNRFSGIFTAPHSGTYVFTWTAYCFAGGHTSLQLVVNANVYISSYCNASGALWHRSVSGTVVAKINQGDVVFLRTHPTGSNKGNVVSSIFHRTAFAGWSLF